MYIGFTKRLKALGGLRVGFGKRVSGATGAMLFCLAAIINLCWYMILGCVWLAYGAIWLMFILPIKAIKKHVNKINKF